MVGRYVNMVCWWVPAGEVPTLDDAMRRLDLVRELGPTPEAFLFSDPIAAPTAMTNN